MQFLHVHTGNVGSVHDARVFRNSDLRAMLESESGQLPSSYHLLGDSAYPNTAYLLAPFRDNGHLSPIQKRFNLEHSRTRVTVEHAIGLLKGKFRRLKHLDMLKLSEIPTFIFAMCVLHNFMLKCNDADEEEIDLSDENLNNEFLEEPCTDITGDSKRLEIANLLC